MRDFSGHEPQTCRPERRASSGQPNVSQDIPEVREVKTDASEAPLPLPVLCVTALAMRKRQQDADKSRAGDAWIENGLIFTTRHGTPIEPRNFNRSFDRCIAAAQVPRITVHGTRKTCATMEIYTEAPSEATVEALRKLSEQLAA